MKKTLSLILAVLMTLSCASLVFADAAIADEGRDINVEAYQDSIAFLDAYDIYNGDMTETDATNDVLRWHMALFVARITTGLLNDKDWKGGPEDYSEFTDIDGVVAESYLGAISYASQMGIINGYGDGTFGPYDGIQYQQAVTMLCRALGYNGLEYPWGYMQKATNIGLDAVIKDQDVAPTTELCRAEVGQLIYNALFVETAKGDTLATRIFGVDFGWENVVITKTDAVAAIAGEDTASKGLVGFKVLLENGTLDPTTYYAYEKAFGLENGHDAELALGKVFKVLFKIENGEFVDVSVAKALYNEDDTITVRADEGDDSAVIKNWLKDLTLVSKYDTEILNGKEMNDEFILQTFGATTYYVYVPAFENKYAIDWNNGHILEKDGDSWKVLWYYNPTFEKYFQIVEKDAVINGVDELINGSTVVGIKYMTEADAAKLQDLFNAMLEIEVPGTGLATLKSTDKLDSSAYADLEVVDVDGDGEYDRGIFKNYEFGYLTVGKCDKGHATVKIQQFEGLAGLNKGKTYCTNAACEKVADFGWLNATETEFTDKGYAIYDYNATTGEIEVIRSGDDFETVTGKLTSIDMTNGKIQIGDTKYPYGYAKLNSTMFTDSKPVISEYLYEHFNQNVTVLLVDGNIVAMDVINNAGFGYIIVDSYAGISSEGKILVNGYNTKNLKYTTFDIESYNGWRQGDYFYNLSAQKLAESFAKGAIYEIVSTETSEYGKTLYNIEIVEAEDIVKDTTLSIDASFVDYGYITINGETVKNKDLKVVVVSDNPIIPISVFEGKVTNETWSIADATYAEIDGAYVVFEGDVVGFGQDQSNVTIAVYTDILNTKVDYDGSANEDWYILGYTKYTIEAFDLVAGAVKEFTGYNLDLKKGYAYIAIDGVIVSAISSLTDILVDATHPYLGAEDAFEVLVDELYVAQSNGVENAKYLTGSIDYDAEAFEKEVLSQKYIARRIIGDVTGKPEDYLKSFVSGVTVFEVKANGDDTIETIKKIDKYADATIVDAPATESAAGKNMRAYYIYDVATAKMIVYACDWYYTDVQYVTPPAQDVTTDNVTIAEGVVATMTDTKYGTGEIAIEAELIGSFTDLVNGADYYTIKGIKFFFTGDLFDTANGTDAANAKAAIDKIVNAGYYFGIDNVNAASVTYEIADGAYGINGIVLGSLNPVAYADRPAVKEITVMFNEGLRWDKAWNGNLEGNVVIDYNFENTDAIDFEGLGLIFNLDYCYDLSFNLTNTGADAPEFVIENGDPTVDDIDLPGINITTP